MTILRTPLKLSGRHTGIRRFRLCAGCPLTDYEKLLRVRLGRTRDGLGRKCNDEKCGFPGGIFFFFPFTRQKN